MKIAVVYYSLEGNTQYCAEKLGEMLGADVIRIEPVKPYATGAFSKFFEGGKSSSFKEKPPLKPYVFGEYDLVILGTPLWAWDMTPPLRTFLLENDLKERKVAAFITSGGGKADKAFANIAELVGHPLESQQDFINVLKNKDKVEEELKQWITFIER